MRLRFLASVANDRGSFIEGQVVDVRTPVPEPFAGWLRQGLVREERGPDIEVAMAPRDIERAVARRQVRRTRAPKGRKSKAKSDDESP